ncbi:MAG: ABC transporter ATP-binding protein [Saprospiraceae bacterium]|nr:ABC transporter ATP-binding protein [Saprospiraceae bacterium]
MMAISIDRISKSYGEHKDVHALREISLSVHTGELFGLIGPDGAGKTTLFRILTTLVLPDRGSATVEGKDVRDDFRDIRTMVGYMPGRFSLYQDLSVEENLRFFATIFHTTIEENYELIKDIYVQIEPFKKRRAGDLSGGMKQKLALCCALIHRPKVLFLDEPTTGVDVVSRKEFWAMLQQLKKQGMTIFVSTPYMDEATLCDRIALIQKGSIMSVDTPENLLNKYQGDLWGIRTEHMYKALQDLNNFPSVTECYTFGAMHHAQVSGLQMPAELHNYLDRKYHKNIRVEKIKPTIEDCFMQLMQADEREPVPNE